MTRDSEAPVHANEGAAAASPDAHAPSTALIAARILRDGELVLLVLRPSRWFILLTSLRFIAMVAILVLLARIFDDGSRLRGVHYLEAGAFLAGCRLMLATLQWMGRLYILTELRILRLSGVFSIDVLDCPLRRVARTYAEATLTERLVRIGSILVVPQDEELPIIAWHMVPRPREVHEKIRATIARARQGGQP